MPRVALRSPRAVARDVPRPGRTRRAVPRSVGAPAGGQQRGHWRPRTGVLGHESAGRHGPATNPGLRGGGRSGSRRHGRGVPGPAPDVESLGGPQDAPGRRVRRPTGTRAVPAGSRGDRRVAAPEHRPGVRGGRTRGPALLHNGVRRGRESRGPPGRGASTRPPGRGTGRHPGGRRGVRSREPDHPPRPETGEHPPHRPRRGAPRHRTGHPRHHRLRSGAPHRRARVHRHRRPDRDPQLHGPGAGGAG